MIANGTGVAIVTGEGVCGMDTFTVAATAVGCADIAVVTVTIVSGYADRVHAGIIHGTGVPIAAASFPGGMDAATGEVAAVHRTYIAVITIEGPITLT